MVCGSSSATRKCYNWQLLHSYATMLRKQCKSWRGKQCKRGSGRTRTLMTSPFRSSFSSIIDNLFTFAIISSHSSICHRTTLKFRLGTPSNVSLFLKRSFQIRRTTQWLVFMNLSEIFPGVMPYPL